MSKVCRQAIDDGSWFDASKAEQFDEMSNHDGSNMVSVVTGSEWDHEELFRTAKGTWVIHRYSQRQGIKDRWELLDNAEAAAWLIKCGHDVNFGDEVFAASEV